MKLEEAKHQEEAQKTQEMIEAEKKVCVCIVGHLPLPIVYLVNLIMG